MAATTCTADVARPVDEVFAYVTDPSKFGEWQQNVIDGRMDDDGPRGVGARCLTTRRIGFATRDVTAEVTALDPPRRWAVRGVDGPIRAIVNVTVEPVEASQRSHVTIAIDFEGHGIGRLLVPLFVRRQAKREMPTNMQRLARQLEATNDST